MDYHTKAHACRIPFTQPSFIFVILLVWTLTCMQDIKVCYSNFSSIIVKTQTTKSMEHSLAYENDGALKVVVGLSLGVKSLLVVSVFIPRLGIALYLLWLGCRWLVATTSFSEIILNAMALEFVMMLKDLLYMALVPERSKLECERTMVYHHAYSLMYASPYGCLAMAWVYGYLFHWQKVYSTLRSERYGRA